MATFAECLGYAMANTESYISEHYFDRKTDSVYTDKDCISI